MSESILSQPAPPADFRLAYGPDPLHIGDLRLPSGDGPHPLVIVVHGGFWRNRYDLEHIGHVCAALTARGLATWSIEYRRIGDPGGGWPGTLLDAGRAADYARELAPRFNLDLDRTVTAGHSAGGHLALWLAARPRLDPASELATPNPLRVRGAVSLAGVSDLRAAYDLRLSQRVVAELLGGSPDEVPERYASASPAELLPLGVPQVLIHGTSDGPVPFQISADYAARAASLGDQARLIPLEGAHHFELIDPGSREWPAVEQAIVAAATGGR
jgi:acetyl esterase/lipase